VLVGVVLAAGLGLPSPVDLTPAAAEPELVLPRSAADPPPELQPEIAPEPSPQAVRTREALADALAAPEAAGTLAVNPSTGLVHEQVVTVSGTGWEPRAWLVTLQCGPAPSGPGDCEYGVDEFRAGPAGRFTTTAAVDVIIDDPQGAIDCRVVTCRLGVLDVSSYALGLRFVDVDFDPGGPDPVHPALTVTPDTGLVDGDRLEVTATGLPIAADFLPAAQLTFCRTPLVDLGDCDRHLVDIVSLEDDGSLDADTWAAPILDLPGGPYDCRAGTCAVVVIPYDLGFDEWGEVSEAAIGDVTFDPGAALRPPPTLTADPDSGLVDGDLVELDGAGFDPDRGYLVQQCLADAATRRDCVGGVISFSATDQTGAVDVVFGVVSKFRTARGFLVDCRVDDCAIVVGHTNFGRHARAPLTFDPDALLLRPTVTVEPSTGLHDGDAVVVTGHGWPALQPVALAQCPAGMPEPFYCGFENAVFLFPGSDDPPILVPAARTRAEAEAGMAFETTFDVDARAEGNGGEVDCRRAPCELVAGDLDGFRVARAPISFGDEVPGPVSAGPSFTG
jgi:hypothetical protein